MDKHTIYDIKEDGLPNVDEDVLVYDHGRWYVASFTGRYAEIGERDNTGNYLIVPIWDDGEGMLGMFSAPPMPTHYIKLPMYIPNSDYIVHAQNVPRSKVKICRPEEIEPVKVKVVNTSELF